MSPEQVRGEELDARSDIFSFGVLLYEMPTGVLPFRGKTSGVLVDGILNRNPEPAVSLNPEIPAEMERILSKSLEKDRDLRYQSAAELRSDLRRVQRDSSERIPALASGIDKARARVGTPERGASSWRRNWLLSTPILLVLVLAGAWWYNSRRLKPRFTGEKEFIRLTESGEQVDSASISSDGKYVTYETVADGKHRLWLLQTATASAVPLVPDSEEAENEGYGGTTFSPDNNFVYFPRMTKTETRGALYSVPILDGTVKRRGDTWSPVTFSPDGSKIAFVRDWYREKKNFLVVANADGTGEHPLVERDSKKEWFTYAGPAWSPDGKRLAVTSNHPTPQGYYSTVDIIGMDGRMSALGPPLAQAARVVWTGDGSGLVYTAWPRPDVQRFQVFFISYPDGVVSHITNDMDSYGITSLGVTADGSTLATTQTASAYQIWTIGAKNYQHAEQITRGGINGAIALDARAGKVLFTSNRTDWNTILITDLKGSSGVQVSDRGNWPRLSPDGKLVAFSIKGTDSKENLWIVRSAGTGLRQLTFGNTDFLPLFSPDAKYVLLLAPDGRVSESAQNCSGRRLPRQALRRVGNPIRHFTRRAELTGALPRCRSTHWRAVTPTQAWS
jgi:Tol biopolymer transport system component